MKRTVGWSVVTKEEGELAVQTFGGHCVWAVLGSTAGLCDLLLEFTRAFLKRSVLGAWVNSELDSCLSWSPPLTCHLTNAHYWSRGRPGERKCVGGRLTDNPTPLLTKQLKEHVFMWVSSYNVGFPSAAILHLCRLSEAQFW